MLRSKSILRVAAVVSSVLIVVLYVTYQVQRETSASAQATQPGSATAPTTQRDLIMPGSKSFTQVLDLSPPVPPPTSRPVQPVQSRTVIMTGSKSGPVRLIKEPTPPFDAPVLELAPPNPLIGKP